MSRLRLFKTRLKISLVSASKVIVKPKYLIASLALTIIMSGFILWSLNLGLLKFVLFESTVSIATKVGFFFDVYKSLYTTYIGVQGLGIVVFSVLFGINMSLIAYVIKNQSLKNVPKGSGFGGIVFALVSGGCVACGTSILAPLLATFGATSAGFVRSLGAVLVWAGSILIAYSIYKLGGIISTVLAKSSIKTLDNV